VDRDSAQKTLKAGLLAGALAVFSFGAAFYVTVLYIS
jgi:hypothetical protein